MSVKRFDVAIVGAGPAGSSTAISLARKGYAVVLLDKAFFPREKLCGDFLNPAAWDLFERLSVADRLLSLEHEKITSFLISTPSGQAATVEFASRGGRRPFGLGLRRSLLDNLLLEAAVQEGVVARQGCRVAVFARERGEWSIFLDSLSKRESLGALFLVGADGRNSLVAHRLGLARTGGSRAGYLAFQTHLRGVRGLKSQVQIHSFPGGYAGLVELGGGAANLCFVVKKKRAQEQRSLQELMAGSLLRNQRLRESLSESAIVGDLRSAYPVYFSPRRSWGDGFLLVGDAARVAEPVTGKGVYFALQSGIFAADALHFAFANRSRAPESFSVYHRLCQGDLFRQGVDALVRAAIYRPSLIKSVVWLSTKGSFPLRPLVHSLCRSP